MAARELTAKQKLFVSAYVGPARFNATEAARLAGYSGNDKTIQRMGSENLSKPLIKAEIDATINQVVETAISIKQNRIDALNDRWERMKQLIEIRSADSDIPANKGGKTGLLVHSIKVIGTGQSQQTINEFTFDAALFREMRETEKQAAQESGQWTEKVSHSGTVTFADLHTIAAGNTGADDPQSVK